MKKKIAIALVLCLVVVGIMAGPVFAEAQKVDLIPYTYGGTIPADPGSGFVIANNSTGASELTIALKGAVPEADYYVWININNMGWGLVGILSTNVEGNGIYHGKWSGIPTGTYDVVYALNRPLYTTKFITDPVTLNIK